jgi:hypothetical protein
MRLRIVLGILGTLLKILGVLMLAPGIVSTIYDEPAGVAAFALDVGNRTMEEMICAY